MIELKKATPTDAEMISLLGRITFSETFKKYFIIKQDLDDYLAKTFSVDKIKNSLNDNENVFWLIYTDKLPIGYAKLKLNSSSPFVPADKVCQLQKIYILADFISLGVGKTLCNAVLQEAYHLGYEFIWLSVLQENAKAISFYEKGRFEIIGEHTFQIGSQIFQFYAMGKNLSLE